MRRKAMGRMMAVFFFIGTVFVFSGCRTTIGNLSLWARPAVAIPPRAMNLDDGGEYMYVERYDPRGDSVFIMIRIYPKGEKENQSLVNSNLRDWPKRILKKLKSRD